LFLNGGDKRNLVGPPHVSAEPRAQECSRGVPKAYTGGAASGREALAEISRYNSPRQFEHGCHDRAKDSHPQIARNRGMIENVEDRDSENDKKSAIPLGQDLPAGDVGKPSVEVVTQECHE